jgi:hypothetical protein
MRKPLLLACALAALPALSGARAACPADEAVERMALAIVENRPGEPLSGMTSLADGQCAQDKLVPLLSRQLGRPVGYKVGLTNPAAQQRFGVPHPSPARSTKQRSGFATAKRCRPASAPSRWWKPTCWSACATRASTRRAPTRRCCATSIR